MTRIGVLALQGDFAEHAAVLKRLGAEARQVRKPQELSGLDGLIIPGGESTTFCRLIMDFGLYDPLRKLARDGLPMWGTCAGLIILARQASGLDLPTLEALDIAVQRNAYGRQLDSFEADIAVPALAGQAGPFHAVFIRAPVIVEVGPHVDVLARLEENDSVVAVRQDNILATAFHPELTEDTRFHRYFLDMIEAHKERRSSAK